MKHLDLKSRWSVSAGNRAALRCEMSYGRTQTAEAFLPIVGEVPVEDGVLVEGAFQVARRKEDDRIIVRGGEDVTNRCILTVGASGGFRGGVDVLKEGTTGRVLLSCSAGNACESEIQVVALIAEGESLAFHRFGRDLSQVVVHTWTGREVATTVMSMRQWSRRNDPAHAEGNIRWLGSFRAQSMSGNAVCEGVTLKDGKLTRWVMAEKPALLAHGFGFEPDAEIKDCRVGRDMHDELVLAPVPEGESVDMDRVLVHVHEYTRGSGAKRWPSFHVDWDNAGPVEKLVSAYRGKGSGRDTYTLVLVSAGWSENIAGQFVNERDLPGQVVAFKPDFVPEKKAVEPADRIPKETNKVNPGIRRTVSTGGGNAAMAEALRRAGLVNNKED